MRGTRAGLCAASLAALLAVPLAPATGTAAGPYVREVAASQRLGVALGVRRQSAGIEPVYLRPDYQADAEAIAVAAASGDPVPAPRDGAQHVVSALLVPAGALDYWVATRIDLVAAQLAGLLASPLYTDAGWAVMAYRQGGGVHLGVAAVVGSAPAAVTVNARCTPWGYCWNARGLNPHLPWTRTQVAWKASTVGLPPGGEGLVREAVARVAAVPGLGADLVYGGLTTATGPRGTDRFVVSWGSGCPPGSLGCAAVSSYGGNRLIYAARAVVNPARYDPRARELNIGTIAHEIAHSMGLGHYDGRLADGYQLMRATTGANTPRTGDRNGLRTLNPPGALTAGLALSPGPVASGGLASATVTGRSSGLGALRYLGVDCTDGSGAWRTVASVGGVFDARGRAVVLSWVAGDRSALCRAVVRSRTGRAESTYASLLVS